MFFLTNTTEGTMTYAIKVTPVEYLASRKDIDGRGTDPSPLSFASEQDAQDFIDKNFSHKPYCLVPGGLKRPSYTVVNTDEISYGVEVTPDDAPYGYEWIDHDDVPSYVIPCLDSGLIVPTPIHCGPTTTTFITSTLDDDGKDYLMLFKIRNITLQNTIHGLSNDGSGVDWNKIDWGKIKFGFFVETI